MKKFCFIIFFVTVTSTTSAQPPTDPRLKELEVFATKVLKDWKAPGVSIAVVEKRKVVYTGGFGYRDLEKKLPVTENTQFAIGSCTKAFTAAILGMLEKDGKVNLDKPVRNYLSELKFQNEYTNAHATLRDMMSHRTGLPRHDLSWYASWASRNEFLARIEHLEPTAELREKWQYNNFMYLAQGVVIEKVTGKSWEDNMKEKILKPLGMDNTNLSTNDMEKSTDHSLAYATVKDSAIKAIPYRNIDAMGPAGSVNSSAKDMTKWLITWINGGKFEGKEVIPGSYVTQAMTLQMATGGGLPGQENPDVHFGGYGLGWGMSSYRGHYRVEHGGGIDGFISSTGFFPSDSIGIFVASNQGGPVSAIRNFIADRMLKLTPRDWNKTLLDAAKKARESARAAVKNDSLAGRKFNTKPSHDLKDYTGTYTNPGYGSIEFTLKDGNLASKFNTIDIRVEHYHFDQFRAFPDDPSGDSEPMQLNFQINEKGGIGKLLIPFQTGAKDIEFTKESKGIDVAKGDLQKYVGDYELAPGVFAKFYIKGEKTLYAFIQGQPEYELVPTEKNKFDLKALKGYSVLFEENEKKEIVSVNFVQPNGVFKAKRR